MSGKQASAPDSALAKQQAPEAQAAGAEHEADEPALAVAMVGGMPDPRRLGPRQLLSLQQRVGNQAVQRLIQRQVAAPRSAATSGAATAAAPRATSGAAPLMTGLPPAAPEPAPTVEPATREAVRDAVAAGTLTVAVYTAAGEGADMAEFEAAATSFAHDHRAAGVREGRLVVGEQAAQAATSTAEVVRAVNQTLAQVRALLGRNDITINTLALFAHGINSRRPGRGSYLNLGEEHEIADAARQEQARVTDRLGVDEFVSQVSAALSDRARVVLYACELGDASYNGEHAPHGPRGTADAACATDATDPTSSAAPPPPASSEYQTWSESRQLDAQRGALEDELAVGDASFADQLRDLLNATGASREVWGHRTTGHTTGNPTWRRYGGGTTDGADRQLFGERAASADMTPAEGRSLQQANQALARQVVAQICAALQDDDSGVDRRTLAQLQARAGGLPRWVARELPFAPTPFVEDRPPAVREGARGRRPRVPGAVISFFVARAAAHEPPRDAPADGRRRGRRRGARDADGAAAPSPGAGGG